MTVAAAVVRWVGLVVALACVGAAQDKGVVDITRCRNGCSAVPEDLWPSCCEAHNTCCQEFAESCMHDCLPRVHTGDVSAVEERPGMCCALYNLCCFRETFRISSSKAQKEEPVSFPIVHRFHVPPPTLQEAINPAPRPAFLAPKQSTDDQDSPKAPKRPSFNRPQLLKKSLRPESPQSFKKPQSAGDEERPSGFTGFSQPDDDKEKPKIRPKFGFLGNRKDPEERRKEAEERRKLGAQGASSGEPIELKVTRRPATADIRQEVVIPEVGEAEPKGPRRLDASINPVVTRKRMRLPSTARQVTRGETRNQEQEASGVRVRKLQVTTAREGRTLGVGRSSIRPSGQQTSSRAQPVLAAGQENPRPSPRRPSQTPPTPIIEDTPKVTIDENPSETVAAAKVSEPLMESESSLIEKEASSPAEVIISAFEEIQEANTAAASTPEQSAVPGEDQAGELSQQEEAMEKKLEPSAAAVEEEAKPEMMEDEKSGAETPEQAAFTPPEIVVDIPEEPEVATAAQDIAGIPEESARIRGGSSRSRSSTREQPSTSDAGQTQTRSRNRGSSRGRATSTRGETSRTASLPGIEEEPVESPDVTRRRSRTRG